MTNWLRFLLTVCKAFFQKKLKWNEEVVQEFRVWFSEADMAIMNNSRYLNFQELSKIRQMIGIGIFGKIVKLKWTPLASVHVIRYKKALKRFEKFTLRSNIIYWDEKFIYQHYVFEKDKKLMASLVVKACFLRRDGVVPSADFFKLAGMNEPPLAPPIPKIVEEMYSLDKELVVDAEAVLHPNNKLATILNK